MASQPPWTEWSLNPEFFAALNAWNRRYPQNRLDRILQSFSEKVDVGKPFLEAIPDGPAPIRGLVKALVHLLQLAGALPAKRKELKEFIDEILAWVEAISQAFQESLPGTFVENTWKDMGATRDLIDEACRWAAEEMISSKKMSSKARLAVIDKQIAEFRRRWMAIHIRFANVTGIRLAQGNDAILKELRELPLGVGMKQMQDDITSIRHQLNEISLAQGCVVYACPLHCQDRQEAEQRLRDLTSLSADIPPTPAVFHGRADVVGALLEALIVGEKDERVNLALLGPAGIGKTSIALATVNHDTQGMHPIK